MFKLTRVVLHNICQHQDADIRIAGGLNAVTGRNAGGKTNLLRAIAYGLTGKVDGTWGTQQKLQTDGTFDPGFVEVYFEGNGKVYRVRRFSTSGIKFPDELTEIAGDTYIEIATRRANVDAMMTELMGVSLDLFFQIMWGRQGELDHMLTAPSAIVSTFLSTVFDTKGLEKLREALKTGLSEIAQLSPQCRVRAEAINKELTEELPDIDVLEKQVLEAGAKRDACAAELQQFQATVAHGMPESDYIAQRDSYNGDIALYEQELAELDKQAPEKVTPPERSIDALREDYATLVVRIDTAQSKIEPAKERLSKYTTSRENLVNKLNELEATAKNNEELLAKKDECCSLCAGKIVDEAKYYKQRCNMLTGFDSPEEYLADVAAWREKLNTGISNFDQQIAKLTKAIEQYTADIQQGTVERDDVRRLQERYAAAERYDAHMRLRQAYVSRIASAKEALKKLERTPRIKDSDAVKENTLEVAVREAADAYTELDRTLMATRLRKQTLLKMLEDCNVQIEQLSINVQANRVLSELRDSLSSKRAQLRYLRGKIQDLNTTIAGYFEEAQMPFSLYLDPDTHLFMYKTADGYVHPAAHLSGAQKSISSVILQMGILTVARPNMNLFMTDEPSEALDVENKFIQAQLFSRLAAIMPAIEGVMLIVTRDTQLIEACGNNIELQGGAM